MRGELASMKGRTRHYRDKALKGSCTEGEYVRGIKDGKRAESLLQNGSLSEQDALLASEVLQNVQEMDEAFGQGRSAPDHEFGVPGGWL